MSKSKKEVSPSAYKASGCKVRNNKEIIKELRAEYRYLRKEIRRIKDGRESWKQKAIERLNGYNLLLDKFLRQEKSIKPKGHQYPTWLITLVVILRIHCNCSYGSITKILHVLKNDYMFGGTEEAAIPCKETCQNWVSKLGYYYLEKIDNELINQEVCLIIDESIRVGTEKLFLALACPAEKLFRGTLSFQDMSVISLKGSDSWKGDEIAKELQKSLSKKGLKVNYIVSDEGNNLKRAAKILEIPHLPDISHLIATCLKKTFAEREDYKGFSSVVSKCQSKLAMGKYCYLRPYKQRVKARFLNQQKVVDWADTIFEKWENLEEQAQEKLELLVKYKGTVEALKSTIEFAKSISIPLKVNGLNAKIIKGLIILVENKIEAKETFKTTKEFAEHLKKYLITYKNFITEEEREGKTVHVCSDIIERLFGCYKAKVSDNYFVTATTIGLELPLICLSKEELTCNIQTALEEVSMTNLKEWRNPQKADNQSAMRAKMFKK
jgi:hypothetical protein